MSYLLRRVLVLALTLFFVSVAVFAAFHIIPGDPALLILGTEASEEQLISLRVQLGTDKPLLVQYGSWLRGVFHGTFGMSLRYTKTVESLIKNRIGVTAFLGVMVLCIVFVVGIPLGIGMGWKRGGVFYQLSSVIAMLGISVPGFFLGILVIWVFGLILHLFVPGSYVSYSENPSAFFRFLIFPAFTIAVPQIALLSKYLSSAVRAEMDSGYVRTARSKGNSGFGILVHHVFKNAIVAVVPMIGMIVGGVFSGSIIIEQVFGISGIGRLLIAAVTSRDFPLAQALVMYIALIVVVVNTLVDIVVQIIDPRIRLSSAKKSV